MSLICQREKELQSVVVVLTEYGGSSQFLHPKETPRTLASRKDTAGVTGANFILPVVFHAGNTVK